MVCSGGLAGLQLVDHAPEAVGFAALDDPGWAIKGGVGLLKSEGNRLGGNDWLTAKDGLTPADRQ